MMPSLPVQVSKSRVCNLPFGKSSSWYVTYAMLQILWYICHITDDMLHIPCFRYYVKSAKLLMICYVCHVTDIMLHLPYYWWYVTYGRFSWGPALFVCSWSKLTYWTPQEGSYIHCYSFVLAGSTKSRFGGTQIWRIQIPKFIFRWVLDPSNMGCPCFCYFSEGSRTRPDGPIKKIPKLLARFDCNLQLCLWPF